MTRRNASNPIVRNSRAIVCLDSSAQLCSRLQLLVDDHDGPSDLILARAQGSAEDLLELCRRLAPAVLVLQEVRLPELPLEELRDLIGSRQVKIVVFSDAVDEDSYESYLRRGCAGVLSSGISDEMLRVAIQAISAGELWFPRKLVSKLACEALLKPTTHKLTRRESDILELISRRLTNQQIADELFISRETVRWHVRSLYAKIGVSTRTGAIREAEQLYSGRREGQKINGNDEAPRE
jgi:DNA-binding NarL/FixJ family response regulator